MSVDWDIAPEGATHFGPSHSYLVEHWFKKAGPTWAIWMGGTWDPCIGGIQKLREDTLIQRPMRKEWTGEGSPPVGVDCECTFDGWGYWRKCRVLCYGKQMIFMEQDGESPDDRKFEGSMNPDGIKFRPIRTPEQIAEDERKEGIAQFIADLKKVNGCGFTSHAEDLWDMGYRKQVNP